LRQELGRIVYNFGDICTLRIARKEITNGY